MLIGIIKQFKSRVLGTSLALSLLPLGALCRSASFYQLWLLPLLCGTSLRLRILTCCRAWGKPLEDCMKEYSWLLAAVFPIWQRSAGGSRDVNNLIRGRESVKVIFCGVAATQQWRHYNDEACSWGSRKSRNRTPHCPKQLRLNPYLRCSCPHWP